MTAASLSLLAFVALGMQITADEIAAACVLLILIVVPIWMRWRGTKRN
jgi:hypothetical protein